MHRQFGLLLALALSLLAPQAWAKDKPDITETFFDAPPMTVHYFEDSDIILASNPDNKTTYRSTDAGVTWKSLKGVEEGAVFEVLKHPYDAKTAVVLGSETTHWITRDRGESWQSFQSEEMASTAQPGIRFHATDPDRMIFLAQTCEMGVFCQNSLYYTLDGFDTDPIPLSGDREDLVTCMWAKTTDIFTTGDAKLDRDQILCVARGKFDSFSPSNRVLITSDFFKTEPHEPLMSDGRPVHGVTSLAAVKRYLVFAAKSERTTELAMYVTDDTEIWHRAEFGEHKLEEGAYTLLESTNYSMQVDVMTTSEIRPMGVLLTSNSNGTFFTKNIEHTNRNERGFVDFEKISSIQGIVLVNTVENWKDVERGQADKSKQTSISFDDGRTWESLKAGKDGKDTLHLHSITAQRNMGRLYSSPAPGIVMGIGNTGSHLKEYSKGDLYVSDNAGATWSFALESPHFFEFGAQGSILVAVEDDETDKIKWSLDHGDSWDDMELEDKIKPVALTTTPDSTSLKFFLIGIKVTDDKFYTYSLDFNGLHERDCSKESDYERWTARKNEDGKAACVMGQTQIFKRRKAKTKCLVPNNDFQDPEEERTPCECTRQDYECDYNFRRDEDGDCVQVGPISTPKGACEDDETTFKGTSGYRLIPGNQCTKGVDLLKPVERDCSESTTPPASGNVTHSVTFFKGSAFAEYYYLEREPTAAGDDETIVMRTTKTDRPDRSEVWKTHDHGKNWEQILKGEEVEAIYPHQYFNDRVYIITDGKRVYYSKNRLRETTIHSFKAPHEPNRVKLDVLSFHPSQPDWLIWTGQRQRETIAAFSTHGGEDWDPLLSAVRKCQFVFREDRRVSDKLVYCEYYEGEFADSKLALVSSDDWFNHKNDVRSNVVNFALMSEYIVVAVDDQDVLKVDTSVDATTFADAKFPPFFDVPTHREYTVLESSTHAIFLHVTVNSEDDQEYGSIIKSNSNGTSYVLSADYVNRNDLGYVDFEKMQGIEGVAIINKVANPDSKEGKKLKSYITHNDGATWALLPTPEQGEYSCSGTSEKCSLHLHGYTERDDPRNTYSSPSAIGMMMATGNVGEFLTPRDEADTFITRDGGVTWQPIAHGRYVWEYGDQGSIIVAVQEDKPVDHLLDTLNEGLHWTLYNLDEEMTVRQISTVPSDTSRNFLLWGEIDGKNATINVDFTGLAERSRLCNLNEGTDAEGDGDYYLWSPKHPQSEDDCLFGHVSQFHRKKLEAECYNGKGVPELHDIARNCTCTREDFECDYNYEPGPNNVCNLVKGLKASDPQLECYKDPDLEEYMDITGYRRIPLTTCHGGRELDYTYQTYPCPGHEEGYQKKHGISGVGLMFAIMIPMIAASAVGYWVWRNWDGKFGRIQLGDSMGATAPRGSASNGLFDRDAPWVRYPVIAISGVVAVIAATPVLLGSLWRVVSTRLGRRRGGYSRPFTSRSSFQRGRGNYTVVDPDEDEGELLGEDSDDEA